MSAALLQHFRSDGVAAAAALVARAPRGGWGGYVPAGALTARHARRRGRCGQDRGIVTGRATAEGTARFIGSPAPARPGGGARVMAATGWHVSRVGFGGDDYGCWSLAERFEHLCDAVVRARRNVVSVDGDGVLARAAARAGGGRSSTLLWQARGRSRAARPC